MRKLIYGSLFLALVTIVGCKKENLIEENANLPIGQTNESSVDVDGNEIRLGKRLENPYSVGNMQKAYDNLNSKGELRQKSNIVIEATHYYVRFLPKDGEELGILNADTTIHLFDYPLDVQIEQEGVYYHDPSLTDSAITWQYTVVPVNYSFPSIQYEKLADLFLNEEKKNLKSAKVSSSFYEQLEEESFKLTGNEDDLTNLDDKESIQLKSKSSKWNPDGYIKVYDDALGSWQPIVGLTVRARRWFTIKKATTNSSGYFRTGDFKRPVNYSIKWEHPNRFDIRKGSYGQAYTNGPKKKGRWNQSYNKDNFYWAYGIVFRAAHIYYTQNWRWGIKTPPYNRGLLKQNLHIGIKDKNSNNAPHYFDFNKFWQSAQVVLYYPFSGSYTRSSENVFATTIHEVAHASHWEIANQNLNWLLHSGKTMVESWANGVENEITKTFYSGYNSQVSYVISFKNTIFGQQITNEYTPIVEDMIDDFNQSCYDYDYSNPCPYGGTRRTIGYKFGKQCSACEVGTAPSGTNAFVWPDNQGDFFHSSLPGNYCTPPSGFDGENCYYSGIPNDWYGFVQNNKFFLDSKSKFSYPIDHVSGYTLQQLENALKDVNTMGQWKNKIKSLYNNDTEKYLDELFGNYNF